MWKLLQQATVGYTAPLGTGLLIEGGLFLSPVGVENLAVKDSWNWSRSTLFFALPAYQTGVRATYTLAPHLTTTVSVFNGWNNVLDNNDEKTFAAQLDYFLLHDVSFRVVYMTGVERPTGDPHGRAWRHLFDGWLMWYPNRWLTLLAHLDAGFEQGSLGTNRWESGALYFRIRFAKWLRFAARADLFAEQVDDESQRSRDALYYPAARVVSSGTVTLDLRPAPNVSIRLEYRHDQASAPMYFAGTVPTTMDGAPVPTAASQDTFTVGTTAWF